MGGALAIVAPTFPEARDRWLAQGLTIVRVGRMRHASLGGLARSASHNFGRTSCLTRRIVTVVKVRRRLQRLLSRSCACRSACDGARGDCPPGKPCWHKSHVVIN